MERRDDGLANGAGQIHAAGIVVPLRGASSKRDAIVRMRRIWRPLDGFLSSAASARSEAAGGIQPVMREASLP